MNEENKNKIFIIGNNEENKEYINNSIIPSYQRGYKWEAKNIVSIMNIKKTIVYII